MSGLTIIKYKANIAGVRFQQMNEDKKAGRSTTGSTINLISNKSKSNRVFKIDISMQHVAGILTLILMSLIVYYANIQSMTSRPIVQHPIMSKFGTVNTTATQHDTFQYISSEAKLNPSYDNLFGQSGLGYDMQNSPSISQTCAQQVLDFISEQEHPATTQILTNKDTSQISALYLLRSWARAILDFPRSLFSAVARAFLNIFGPRS